MARIDDAGFVMIVMTVAVLLFLLHLPQLFASPGAPEHPCRRGKNDDGGNQLEPGFGRLSGEFLTDIHSAHRNQPDH